MDISYLLNPEEPDSTTRKVLPAHSVKPEPRIIPNKQPFNNVMNMLAVEKLSPRDQRPTSRFASCLRSSRSKERRLPRLKYQKMEAQFIWHHRINHGQDWDELRRHFNRRFPSRQRHCAQDLRAKFYRMLREFRFDNARNRSHPIPTRASKPTHSPSDIPHHLPNDQKRRLRPQVTDRAFAVIV